MARNFRENHCHGQRTLLLNMARASSACHICFPRFLFWTSSNRWIMRNAKYQITSGSWNLTQAALAWSVLLSPGRTRQPSDRSPSAVGGLPGFAARLSCTISVHARLGQQVDEPWACADRLQRYLHPGSVVYTCQPVSLVLVLPPVDSMSMSARVVSWIM
jgi:hypothetical protein